MSANDPKARYAVDIVFCIDCTGSMHPYLDSVKATAQQFDSLLQEKMAVKDKGITQLRVRVVAYRDIDHDDDLAFETTEFLKLPDESSSFVRFVNDLQAGGGGDEPESGLEALALAFRSKWERTLDKRRHIVVMCTDASAHPLGKHTMTGFGGGQDAPFPTSLEELISIWGDEDDDGEMEYSAKRLLIFGPEMYPWADFAGMFENCIYLPSVAGAGMSAHDLDAVLEAVAGSV